MRLTPLRIILLIAFVDLAGFGLIIPLQAVYAKRLGASGLTFGLLVATYALMQMIFNPVLGRWSDRIGRRKVLLLCMTGSAAGHVLLGIADLAQSLPLLFVARTIDGITGANVATAQAYIADVTSGEDRAKGMGLFGAAFGLGFIVGPSLGSLLVVIGTGVSGETAGTSYPAFGAALVSLIAALLVATKLPEPERKRENEGLKKYLWDAKSFAAVLARPRVRELMIFAFVTVLAFVLLEVTFVYLLEDSFGLGAAGTGLMFAYIGALTVIVQGGLVGKASKRFGEPRVVSVAPFVTAVGFVALGSIPATTGTVLPWLVLFLGCLPVTLGHGMTGPNVSALFSRHACADTQGEVLGSGQAAMSLARTLAPPLGGFLYDVRPGLPYFAGALLLALAATFALTTRREQEIALSQAHVTAS